MSRVRKVNIIRSGQEKRTSKIKCGRYERKGQQVRHKKYVKLREGVGWGNKTKI